MSIISAFAIYFVMWWTVLFAVLPFGVQNAHETGEAVQDGNEHGAPVNALILRKALITTAISGVLFSLFYAGVSQGWVNLDTLPFYNTMPSPNA